jgi:hypothetical protein
VAGRLKALTYSFISGGVAACAGLTSKIYVVVDTNGLPIHLGLMPGEAHHNRLCSILLSALLPQTIFPANRCYGADWLLRSLRRDGAYGSIVRFLVGMANLSMERLNLSD